MEQFHPRRSKHDVAPPNQSRVRREINPPKPSDKEKENREFLRELREALRNTRATYAAVTKLMNREHTSEKKKLFVKQVRNNSQTKECQGPNSFQEIDILKEDEGQSLGIIFQLRIGTLGP